MKWSADSKGELATVLSQVPNGEIVAVVVTENGQEIDSFEIAVRKRPKSPTKARRLGFMNIQFKSDLLEPTDPELIALFYGKD